MSQNHARFILYVDITFDEQDRSKYVMVPEHLQWFISAWIQYTVIAPSRQNEAMSNAAASVRVLERTWLFLKLIEREREQEREQRAEERERVRERAGKKETEQERESRGESRRERHTDRLGQRERQAETVWGSRLNANKTKEMIIFRRRSKSVTYPPEPLIPGAERVTAFWG